MSVNFVPVDASEIEKFVLGMLEMHVGEPLFPGDERRVFGEAMTATLISALNFVDDACRQRILRYARGEVLDAIGDMRGVKRLEPEKAHIIARFSASAPVQSAITIPQGTKIGDGTSLFFVTDAVAVISSGGKYVDIGCTSIEGSSQYAKLSVGAIARMVDLIPGVSSVENITESTGGHDGETYDEDGDEHYRERIRLASGSYSVAGSEEAYRFWALSADPGITAVAIANPADGHVQIVPIMQGGALPTQDVLDKIVMVCNDIKVRPMTDLVTAVMPVIKPFDVEVHYYTLAGGEREAIEAVEADGGAISRYILWQMTQLGRDINPDQLRKEILSAGAMRVEVTAPGFQVLSVTEVAQFSGNLAVSHEVAEE